MITFIIKNIMGNRYFLIDPITAKRYELFLNFYGVEIKLNENDLIKIHEKLLDRDYEGFSLEYNFSPLSSPYGRVIKSKEDVDLLTIKQDEKTIKLKRVYG